MFLCISEAAEVTFSVQHKLKGGPLRIHIHFNKFASHRDASELEGILKDKSNVKHLMSFGL